MVLILIHGKPVPKILEEMGFHEEKTTSIRECFKSLVLAKRKTKTTTEQIPENRLY